MRLHPEPVNGTLLQDYAVPERGVVAGIALAAALTFAMIYGVSSFLMQKPRAIDRSHLWMAAPGALPSQPRALTEAELANNRVERGEQRALDPALTARVSQENPAAME